MPAAASSGTETDMRQDYRLVTARELFDNKDSYADRTVTVGGWIRSNRDSKAVGFIALSDGSCGHFSWCTVKDFRILAK